MLFLHSSAACCWRPICRLTAFGGVSWFQPWSHHPPSLARQLAYSTRRDGADAGEGPTAPGATGPGAGSSDAAAPEARVLVVDPLPLVQLSLQPAEGAGSGQQESGEGLGLLPAGGGGGSAAAGGDGSAAPTGPRALRLLQGQAYAGRLTVTNCSKVPLGWASVNVR